MKNESIRVETDDGSLAAIILVTPQAALGMENGTSMIPGPCIPLCNPACVPAMLPNPCVPQLLKDCLPKLIPPKPPKPS